MSLVSIRLDAPSLDVRHSAASASGTAVFADQLAGASARMSAPASARLDNGASTVLAFVPPALPVVTLGGMGVGSLVAGGFVSAGVVMRIDGALGKAGLGWGDVAKTLPDNAGPGMALGLLNELNRTVLNNPGREGPAVANFLATAKPATLENALKPPPVNWSAFTGPRAGSPQVAGGKPPREVDLRNTPRLSGFDAQPASRQLGDGLRSAGAAARAVPVAPPQQQKNWSDVRNDIAQRLAGAPPHLAPFQQGVVEEMLTNALRSEPPGERTFDRAMKWLDDLAVNGPKTLGQVFDRAQARYDGAIGSMLDKAVAGTPDWMSGPLRSELAQTLAFEQDKGRVGRAVEDVGRWMRNLSASPQLTGNLVASVENRYTQKIGESLDALTSRAPEERRENLRAAIGEVLSEEVEAGKVAADPLSALRWLSNLPSSPDLLSSRVLPREAERAGVGRVEPGTHANAAPAAGAGDPFERAQEAAEEAFRRIGAPGPGSTTFDEEMDTLTGAGKHTSAALLAMRYHSATVQPGPTRGVNASAGVSSADLNAVRNADPEAVAQGVRELASRGELPRLPPELREAASQMLDRAASDPTNADNANIAAARGLLAAPPKSGGTSPLPFENSGRNILPPAADVAGALPPASPDTPGGVAPRGLNAKVDFPGPNGPWIGHQELGDTFHTLAALYALDPNYDGKINLLAPNAADGKRIVEFMHDVLPKATIVVHSLPSTIPNDGSPEAARAREDFFRTVKADAPDRPALGHPFDATRTYGQQAVSDQEVVSRFRERLGSLASPSERKEVTDFLEQTDPALLDPSVEKAIIFTRRSNDWTAGRDTSPEALIQLTESLQNRGMTVVVMGPRPVEGLPEGAVDLTEHWKTVPGFAGQAALYDTLAENGTRMVVGTMSGAVDFIHLSADLPVIEIGPAFRMGMWQDALGEDEFAVVDPGRGYDATSPDPAIRSLSPSIMERVEQLIDLQSPPH